MTLRGCPGALAPRFPRSVYYLGMKQLFLDVETQKTFDEVGGYFPDKLGVSFVGLIERDGFPESGPVTETRHELFAADLHRVFDLLTRADLVIGFNLIGFDLPALSPYGSINLKTLPVLDLLAVIKQEANHRVSLDAVAGQTLNTRKSGSGLDAITYYRQKQFKKLAAYCMKDVEITRDLYDYGRRHGHVKFLNHWNNLVELPVDFSFSPPVKTGTQLSLV